MQRVTLIDNYDSFTFNLVHYLGELGAEVEVWRNDEIAVADALEALVAVKADTPGDRRYAYDHVRANEPKTAADALGRAIVAGRLAQVSGLAATGLGFPVARGQGRAVRPPPRRLLGRDTTGGRDEGVRDRGPGGPTPPLEVSIRIPGMSMNEARE